MTPQEQRVAISESCSWTQLEWNNEYLFGKSTLGYIEVVPDYPTDLNAMHEVEKVFMSDSNRYWTLLLEITDREGRTMDWRHFGHATASQRAEAFLKTIGKWKPRLRRVR